MNYWDQEAKLTNPQFKDFRSADETVSAPFRGVYTDAFFDTLLPLLGTKLHTDAMATYREELSAWCEKKKAYDAHVEASRVAAAAAEGAGRDVPGGGPTVLVGDRDLALMKTYMTHDSKTDKAVKSLEKLTLKLYKAVEKFPAKDLETDKEEMEVCVDSACKVSVEGHLERLKPELKISVAQAVDSALRTALPRAISAHLTKATQKSTSFRALLVEIEEKFRELAESVPEPNGVWSGTVKGKIKNAMSELSLILNKEVLDKYADLFKAAGEPVEVVEVEDDEEDDDGDDGERVDTGDTPAALPAAPLPGSVTVVPLGVTLAALTESPLPATGPYVPPGDTPAALPEAPSPENGPAVPPGDTLAALTEPPLPATGLAVPLGDTPAALTEAPPPGSETIVDPSDTPEDLGAPIRHPGRRPSTRQNPGVADGRAPSPNPPDGPASQVDIYMSYVDTQEGSSQLGNFPWSLFDGSPLDGSQPSQHDGGMPTQIALHTSIEQRDARAASRAAYNSLDATQPQPSLSPISPTY